MSLSLNYLLDREHGRRHRRRRRHIFDNKGQGEISGVPLLFCLLFCCFGFGFCFVALDYISLAFAVATVYAYKMRT